MQIRMYNDSIYNKSWFPNKIHINNFLFFVNQNPIIDCTFLTILVQLI